MAYADQKFNIFTEQEIARIQEILATIAPHPHSVQNVYTNGFTIGDSTYDQINQLVIKKINDSFEQKITKLTVGMQLIAQTPFGPHSDFGSKNDSGFGYAYLIPLYVKNQDPASTLTSNTIVFDQEWLGTSVIDYINSNPAKPKNNVEPIWDEYFSCWPKEIAEYLSVKLIAKWVPGSVIVWDRRLIHSSDNFLAKGIKEKSALILFTSSDTQ